MTDTGDTLGGVIGRIVDAISDWWEWNFGGGQQQAELERQQQELERQRLEYERWRQQVAAENQRTWVLAIAGVAAVGLAAWALTRE